MSTKKKDPVQGDKLKLYRALVETNPNVELKGATHPYTSLNGNMFSHLHPSGSVALRLGENEREQFLKKFQTTLFKAYGVVQKEYVTVPDSLLHKTKELAQYFELSFQYVQTLKPKPSKKKKST
jgi:TfoX/Sxy family transcriptional regulator of competence genes